MEEIEQIFNHLEGVQRIMAMLVYGCGLRLQECLRLRIKDVDIEQNIVVVRSGKGDKYRRTVLPESLKDELIKHIAEVKCVYDKNRKYNVNGVWLPGYQIKAHYICLSLFSPFTVNLNHDQSHFHPGLSSAPSKCAIG